MATLGGVSEVAGTPNSLEIDSLARYAVEQHNAKHVSFFSHQLLSFMSIISYDHCFCS